MQYEVLNDEQISEYKLPIKPGKCEFIVDKFEEKLSKAGNEMAVLTMRIWDFKGKSAVLSECFLSTFPIKIHDFFVSVGNEELFNGDFNENVTVGKSGLCEVGTREYQGKTYLCIKKFIPQPSVMNDTTDKKFEDDIPF